MATNEETSNCEKQELDVEGILREVTDGELSRLAPRLGKDWRGFMREELTISQLDIERAESEPHLPLTEKIYRLLRLWKTRSEEKSTISCLVRHLQNFEYGIDTWEFLTRRERLSSSEETDVGVSETKHLSSEPPYYIVSGSMKRRFTSQFCYVVEINDNLKIDSFQGTLHYPKDTKLDIIDATRTHSYLARDINGNVIPVSKERCQRLQLHSPVLWENNWFHEEATRSQLKEIFSGCERGSFLIRESSEPGCFAISVKDAEDVINFKIKCTQTGYILSDYHFYNLIDLISCFKGTSIFISEKGRLFLRDYVSKGKL